MSRFYGTLHGDNRPEVTRRGLSSIETYTASWRGAVRVCAYRDGDRVRMSRFYGTLRGRKPKPETEHDTPAPEVRT